MNAITRNLFFLLLLSCAVISLPACGSKTNVNGEKNQETVLNPEETPPPAPSGSSESKHKGPARSYVAKIHRTKGPNSTTTITTTPVTSNEAAATNPAPANPTPEVETPAPVKKGGHLSWLLWILVLMLVGGIGWYFWMRSKEGHSSMPSPPTGGLSPVSGFTAVRDQIEEEADSHTSFWFRKLF